MATDASLNVFAILSQDTDFLIYQVFIFYCFVMFCNLIWKQVYDLIWKQFINELRKFYILIWEQGHWEKVLTSLYLFLF